MNYTNKDIINGLECWMSPEISEIECKDCPFRREHIDGTPVKDEYGVGICKILVLEEARKVLQ
jgi:hypothetical protein